MKLITDTAWFSALKDWRGRRRAGQEPADMGTAFGLDSITVVDFESTADPHTQGGAASVGWERRVTRRSRL